MEIISKSRIIGFLRIKILALGATDIRESRAGKESCKSWGRQGRLGGKGLLASRSSPLPQGYLAGQGNPTGDPRGGSNIGRPARLRWESLVSSLCRPGTRYVCRFPQFLLENVFIFAVNCFLPEFEWLCDQCIGKNKSTVAGSGDWLRFFTFGKVNKSNLLYVPIIRFMISQFFRKFYWYSMFTFVKHTLDALSNILKVSKPHVSNF